MAGMFLQTGRLNDCFRATIVGRNLQDDEMRAMVLAITIFGIALCAPAFADAEITDANLRQAVEELSASTLVGGEGWKTYDRLLHADYSRWAMGEVFERRTKFIRSLEEWWNYGMRVAERDVEMVAVDLVGDLAIIRYMTTESFAGPEGPVDGFSGYVSNIWVKDGRSWLLLSAEISSTERTD